MLWLESSFFVFKGGTNSKVKQISIHPYYDSNVSSSLANLMTPLFSLQFCVFILTIFSAISIDHYLSINGMKSFYLIFNCETFYYQKLAFLRRRVLSGKNCKENKNSSFVNFQGSIVEILVALIGTTDLTLCFA